MPSSIPCRLLFVYGTLRRRCRHPMARYLADNANFMAEATTPGRLYDLGRFPGAIPARANDERIHGDVYELRDPDTVLADLDRYENDESTDVTFYERTLVEVTLAEGRQEQAWMYWLRGKIPAGATWIPSGIYERDFVPRSL